LKEIAVGAVIGWPIKDKVAEMLSQPSIGCPLDCKNTYKNQWFA
jgi:hypothetical protein